MRSLIGKVVALTLLFGSTAVRADEAASQLHARWQSVRVMEPAETAASEIAEIELLFARSLDLPMKPATVGAWAEL